MIVREYTDADFTRIKHLHEVSGYDYQLPEMDSFFSKKVVGDGEGIGAAVFQTLITEVMLVCNPHWRTPAWRLAAIQKLHDSCSRDAMIVGAQHAMASLPPQVADTKFTRRLTEFGWVPARPEWKTYFHSVG